MKNNPLIRGGQTTLHDYRMSLQVLKILFRTAMGITLVFLISTLSLNLTLHEVYQWLLWHWAQLLYSITNKYKQQITIFDYDWNPYLTYTGTVFNNARIAETKIKVEELFMAGGVLGLILGFIIATLAAGYFLWRGARLQRAKHLRGSTLLPPKELTQHILAFNKARPGGTPYSIAGIPYPAGTPTTHTIICGTTGAGKTTLLINLIAQIRKNGDRAIIYDKMGSFVSKFYDPSKDVICNPFDTRSPGWSVFSEGRKASDFEMMAKALIPEQKGMVDPFWILAARILFSKIADGLRIKGKPTNELLLSQLLKIDLSEMAALLKNTAAQSIIDEQSPKTALSVRAVMSAYLSCLEHLPSGTPVGVPGAPAGNFSIRDWIEDDARDGFLFLTSRGDMHESIKGLTSCWLEIAVNSLLSLDQSRDRKIWIILDEVPSLYNIPSLQPGMAESRQFGGCFVLGLQVWSAMRDIYGPNGAETISGLARTRVALSTPDKATADWCSQSLGNAEKTELQETLSYGAHDMRDGVSLAAKNELRPIVLPTEIMSLPDLTGFLRLPQGFPITKFTIKPDKTPKTTQAFIERPQAPTRQVPEVPSQKSPAVQPPKKAQAFIERPQVSTKQKPVAPPPKKPVVAPLPKRKKKEKPKTAPPPKESPGPVAPDEDLIF
jgi:type IV conjugative transfer system coupling protein TraD